MTNEDKSSTDASSPASTDDTETLAVAQGSVSDPVISPAGKPASKEINQIIMASKAKTETSTGWECRICHTTTKKDGTPIPSWASMRAHVMSAHKVSMTREEYDNWEEIPSEEESDIDEDDYEDEVPEPSPVPDIYEEFEVILKRLGIGQKRREKIVTIMEDYPLDNYWQLEKAMQRAGLKFQERASILQKWCKVAGRLVPQQIADEYGIDTESYGPPRRGRRGRQEGEYYDDDARRREGPSEMLEMVRAFKELKRAFEPESGTYSESEEVHELQREVDQLTAEKEKLEQKIEFQKMLDEQVKPLKEEISELKAKEQGRSFTDKAENEIVETMKGLRQTSRDVKDWLLYGAQKMADSQQPPDREYSEEDVDRVRESSRMLQDELERSGVETKEFQTRTKRLVKERESA